jgi:hypothetical protein
MRHGANHGADSRGGVAEVRCGSAVTAHGGCGLDGRAGQHGAANPGALGCEKTRICAPPVLGPDAVDFEPIVQRLGADAGRERSVESVGV